MLILIYILALNMGLISLVFIIVNVFMAVGSREICVNGLCS